MLFPKRFWAGIADGSVTHTVRRWRRTQVLAGRSYRTPGGMIAVDEVREIDDGDITDALAVAAGYVDAAELRRELALFPRADDPTAALYCIRFHRAGSDPRDALAAAADLTDDDVAAIAARLDRLDRASHDGPWTRATLAVIARSPGVRAGDLAESLGRERAPFKLDVRKLKALGLTISLEVGYRLSPRGEAFQRAAGASE